MRMMGIESSCDETAVALIENDRVVASRVATQEIHSRWGGVVPEIASRLHQKTLSRMAQETLDDAGWSFEDLNGISVTRGPGLIGALLVGVSYAKGVAAALNIPFVGVNHLEGHLWASVADGEEMPLPALAMIVSGGHTELYRLEDFGNYSFLGATLDDAAGEAFDKVGGLLGIPYPAGAKLSKLATEGNSKRFHFAVAHTKSPLDFSFSGLKSAVLREVQKAEDSEDPVFRADIAAAFEASVIKQLSQRVDEALRGGDYKSLLVGGGVAANRALREKLEQVSKKRHAKFLVPPISLCTDNAAMIAYVGMRSLRERGEDSLSLEADPNLTLVEEN